MKNFLPSSLALCSHLAHDPFKKHPAGFAAAEELLKKFNLRPEEAEFHLLIFFCRCGKKEHSRTRAAVREKPGADGKAPLGRGRFLPTGHGSAVASVRLVRISLGTAKGGNQAKGRYLFFYSSRFLIHS
jgi:hypothetical protein